MRSNSSGKFDRLNINVDCGNMSCLQADPIIVLPFPIGDVCVQRGEASPVLDACHLAQAVVPAGRLAYFLQRRLWRDGGARVAHHRQQIGGEPQHQ
jgi:hypothetical protein